MKTVITNKALSDLDVIDDYISKDNPEKAKSFIREIVDQCHKLAFMPEAFPLTPRHRQLGIRRFVFGEYLVFYAINKEQEIIDILHVLHSARDYERIVFPEE